MKRSRLAATAGGSARRDQRILSDGESRARPFAIHCREGGVSAEASRAGAHADLAHAGRGDAAERDLRYPATPMSL